MATAENAKIQIETGRTLTNYTAMTNSGDNQTYTAGTVWSGLSGYEPDVRPNGIITGESLISTASTNDMVNVAAFTAYSAGNLRSPGAAQVTATRSATAASAYKITSVVMTTNGTVSKSAGAAHNAFVETRGAAGGPPAIAADSVEIGQIRVSATTAAVIAAAEIFEVVGTHQERFDYPGGQEKNIGDGRNAATTAEQRAHIKFDSALPLSHAATTTKKIYIKYYTPVFSDLSRTVEFVPAETSHSVSSTQYYGGTVASSSQSLGQGSFSAMLNDNVTDSLLSLKNKTVTVKFFPDRNKVPYILTQGVLGISRTFPVDNQVQADCTLSSPDPSADFAS